MAEASLTALTLSAPCTGGATLLSRLTRLMPFIQAGLRIYNDAFARVGDASKVRDAVQTWLGVADQVALTLHKSYVVGVCVTGGVVKPCPDRYEIAEPYPWLEGARGKLALTAFSRDEQTFVPSTLTISSPNLFPSAVAPDTVVQVLRAGETTLHLQDVPTGHDTSTVTMRVEPGQIRYVSFLGSATNGPLRINEGRMIAVVANSNVTQFQGDVDFTWSVAPGSESIVELIAGGQRSAAVKGLRSGAATIYAVNTVTRRTLEFVVQVEPTITEVVDWTSSTTGKLGSISISISTIGTPPLSNPSLFGGPLVSRIFSSGHFDGPVSLVKSIEVYGKSQQVTNTYTVTFSAPVTDVRVHLGSLASVVTFNQPVTRISGQPSFSVTGSTVTGVVDNSGSITDSNGTIGLSGTFSSFSFTTVGLPNVGLADGIAIQIAARGI